jgi:hypothetical protein
VRARRAARIAAIKAGWAVASIFLLSSTVVEYTQPHPSRFTLVFVVAWIAISVWAYRSIRRLRQEALAG